MNIGLISLMVVIDGETCVVALSQEKLKVLLKLGEGLSESGKLPIKRLGSECKLEKIEKG